MSLAADDVPDPYGPPIADALCRSSVAAADLVRQHLEFNDEILPTVLLGEIGDWYAEAVHHERPDRDDAQRAVQAVATLYCNGDNEMRDAVATGFLEAMPQSGDADRAVIDLLPPPLLEKLRRMESWVPPTP